MIESVVIFDGAEGAVAPGGVRGSAAWEVSGQAASEGGLAAPEELAGSRGGARARGRRMPPFTLGAGAGSEQRALGRMSVCGTPSRRRVKRCAPVGPKCTVVVNIRLQ